MLIAHACLWTAREADSMADKTEVVLDRTQVKIAFWYSTFKLFMNCRLTDVYPTAIKDIIQLAAARSCLALASLFDLRLP